MKEHKSRLVNGVWVQEIHGSRLFAGWMEKKDYGHTFPWELQQEV